MMILLNAATGLAVNPKLIVAIKIVESGRRLGGSGGPSGFTDFVLQRQPQAIAGLSVGRPRLIITMKDGFELEIPHDPEAGIDVRSLHRRLMVSV